MYKFLILGGLVLTGVIVAVPSPGQVPNERQALIDLYQATNGDEWHRNEGWLSEEQLCDWQHVECTDIDGHPRVTRLELENNGLSGQLPHSLAGLQHLTSLILAGNALTGTLPDNRWNLENLKHLSIHGNRFSGSLPDWLLGLDHREVDVSDNRFSGYRVSGEAVSGDGEARRLLFGGNQLDQPPPTSWLQGTVVWTLDLSENLLAGAFDLEGLPADLFSLDVSENALTGVVGLQDAYLPQLDTLYLSGNQLANWPEGLSALGLEALDLSGNRISGNLPDSVAQLELTAIDVSNNNITGSIVPLFQALRIPAWGGNWLLAADNGFTGALPDDLDFSRFNNLSKPNNYQSRIHHFGMQGLDLCWNDLAIDTADYEAINDVHRGHSLETCIGRSRQLVDPGLSGSWYVPQRSGEGITQMLLDNGMMLVYWFTFTRAQELFPGEREQMWLVGVISPDDHSISSDRLEIPTGGRFSYGLGQSSQPRGYGGSFRLRQDRLGADSAQFVYEFLRGGLCVTGFCSWELDTNRFEHDRLTRLAGTTCDTQSPLQQYAGAWYNPERSGEGFIVETLPDQRIVVYWFTYQPDDSGRQAWMIGTGEFDEGEVFIDEMIQPVGTLFGADFDSEEIEHIDWGSLAIEFDGENTGHIEYQSNLDEYGSGGYAIERLARPMLAECDEAGSDQS